MNGVIEDRKADAGLFAWREGRGAMGTNRNGKIGDWCERAIARTKRQISSRRAFRDTTLFILGGRPSLALRAGGSYRCVRHVRREDYASYKRRFVALTFKCMFSPPELIEQVSALHADAFGWAKACWFRS